MSDAAVATIVLLSLAFVAVLIAWGLTSLQSDNQRNIEKVNELDCNELLMFVMDDNNSSSAIDYAREQFLLKGCLK